MKNIKVHILFGPDDNKNESGKGWVDVFSSNLEKLIQLQYKEAQIETILIKAVNANDIVTQSHDSVLVVICGPSLSLYHGKIPSTSGITHRFKILVDYTVASLQPEIVRNLYPYRFYMADPITGTLNKITGEDKGEAKRLYWLSLTQLAEDIVSAVTNAKKDQIDRPGIFLGEATPDVFYELTLLRRELQRYNYAVYPQNDVSTDMQELYEAMQKDLSKCILSVHLIGQDYGTEVVDSNSSIIETQNSIAAKYAKERNEASGLVGNYQNDVDKDFARFIWLSDHMNFVDDKQQFFINRLLQGTEEQYDSEIIQLKIEDFKSTIIQYLDQRYNSNNTKAFEDASLIENIVSGSENEKSIYLICDPVDQENAKAIADWLYENGYIVYWSGTILRNKNLHQRRLLHQEYLKRCDGTLIFVDKVRDEWVKSKLQDILKAPGLGRANKLDNKAIFTTSAEREQEIAAIQIDNKLHRDALLILNKGAFSPEKIGQFLLKLNPTMPL
jgi:hypothetical protein